MCTNAIKYTVDGILNLSSINKKSSAGIKWHSLVDHWLTLDGSFTFVKLLFNKKLSIVTGIPQPVQILTLRNHVLILKCGEKIIFVIFIILLLHFKDVFKLDSLRNSSILSTACWHLFVLMGRILGPLLIIYLVEFVVYVVTFSGRFGGLQTE